MASAERAPMSVLCTAKCHHVAPGCGWPHDTMLEEDAGIIHTDDCGFFVCDHHHDPGECCTAGKPNVKCRVGLPPEATP